MSDYTRTNTRSGGNSSGTYVMNVNIYVAGSVSQARLNDAANGYQDVCDELVSGNYIDGYTIYEYDTGHSADCSGDVALLNNFNNWRDSHGGNLTRDGSHLIIHNCDYLSGNVSAGAAEQLNCWKTDGDAHVSKWNYTYNGLGGLNHAVAQEIFHGFIDLQYYSGSASSEHELGEVVQVGPSTAATTMMNSQSDSQSGDCNSSLSRNSWSNRLTNCSKQAVEDTAVGSI